MPGGITQVPAECQSLLDACGTAGFHARSAARVSCNSSSSRRSARTNRPGRTGPCSRSETLSAAVEPSNSLEREEHSAESIVEIPEQEMHNSQGAGRVDAGRSASMRESETGAAEEMQTSPGNSPPASPERPTKSLKCFAKAMPKAAAIVPQVVTTPLAAVAAVPAPAASPYAPGAATLPDEKVLAGFGVLLARMVSSGADLQASTCFHARAVPKLSIQDYILRIRRHIPCSEACFVLSLVYLDRVSKYDSKAAVTKLSCHRLLLAGIVLAFKFHDDEEDTHYNNAYWAKVGGIGVKELFTLEAQFLQLLNWRLFVPETEYEQYRHLVYSAASELDN